ncbi:hypothetical protein [Streptomyces sp. NPDC046685]|uniref:hypothetical protein n=1 Tax=Streptomyces sp. NPDC046685 TaxID=3157202 RepID=UPI0033DEE12B
MKSKKAIAAAASCTGLSVLAGLFLWWDTNVFATAELCAGKVDGEQAESVLDTRGRVSVGSEQRHVDGTSFRCTVSRTSRITGAEELEVEVSTAIYTPDFPFQTHVWHNSSSRSFLSGEVTGAVSGTRGWVILPEKCRAKVGNVLLGTKFLPGSAEVPVVQAELKKGAVEPQKLTSMLVDTAQKVAAAAGCSTDTLSQTPKVQPPTSPEAITADSICQIPGFRLPDSAVAKDDAKLEEQRTSGTPAGSWACDLYQPGGQDEAQLSFASSLDPNIVNEHLKAATGFHDLPDGTGVADGGNDRAILKCGTKEVYFGVRWNNTYLRSLKEAYRSGQASREVFQTFLDAAGKQHGCPSVTIPAS